MGMYPSCCVISLKWIESTCCHMQYINFFLFLPKNLLVSNSLMCHLYISHNTPCPPRPSTKKKKTKQNKSIIIVFNFSWGNCNTQKELTTKVMQNFGGHRRGIMGVVQINANLLHHFCWSP